MRWMIVALVLSTSTAHAEEPQRPPPPCKKTGKNKTPCVQDIDLTKGLAIGGQNRNPNLMYFLERANEELERAFLERRSFIPELVKTVEAEKL